MDILIQLGYWGLFAGAFLAATIVPLSSDIIYAGVLIIPDINPWIAFVLVTLGNWTGSLTSYWLGYLGKWKWLEKIFKIKPEQLEKQRFRISKHGALLAFFTWLPFIGDVINVALGFYRVNLVVCAIYSLIGRTLRFLVWTLLYLKYGDIFLNFLRDIGLI